MKKRQSYYAVVVHGEPSDDALFNAFMALYRSAYGHELAPLVVKPHSPSVASAKAATQPASAARRKGSVR